ncbi:17347_t:CDS:10, partial [Acaulospora colombiana]
MSGSRNRYGRRSSYQHRPHQTPPYVQQHFNQEHRDSAKLSRVNQLLSRIRDENESVYSRRTAQANQLVNLLAEQCTPWEKSQIFEAVTRGSENSQGLDVLFEDLRAPATFKTAVAKCLAQTAIIMNNEINLYFRWVFDRLHMLGTGSKEKERKVWLLASLREIFSRNFVSVSSQYCQPYIPGLLHDLESLLDSMDSPDCFPGVLEVLDKIAENYSDEFEDRFQDIIDLLAGWYIDTPGLDLHSQISDSFKKLGRYWSQHLNFAYDLMNNFLVDMGEHSGVTVSQDGLHVVNKKIKSEEEIIANLKAMAAAIVPVLSQKTEDAPATNDHSIHHPFDRLRLFVIKFIFAIAEIYMDSEWFEKGNQTILTLSIPRKEFFVPNQVLATKFWLLQVQNGFNKECSASVFEEWFDCFLQSSLKVLDYQSKSHLLDVRSAMLIFTFDIEVLSELACSWNNAAEDLQKVIYNAGMIAKSLLMEDVYSTPHSGNFGPQHFQIAMKNLGMEEFLSAQDEPDNHIYDTSEKSQWRCRLFFSCQGIEMFDRNRSTEEERRDPGDISTVTANSDDLLVFWTVWEVARYCVLSRLRTPFGGPKQTFDVFEKRLNDLLAQDWTIFVGRDMPTNVLNDSLSNISQLREILNIFDRLELQIYNATVGTSLGILPQAPKASIVFFRANRKVCDDWFSRIRTSIVKGAMISGDYALAARHGYQTLVECVAALKQGLVKNKTAFFVDFEQIVIDVVQCLQKLNAADNIIGLLAWLKRISSINDKQEPSVPDSEPPSTSERVESSPQTIRTLLQRDKLISSPEYFSWMTGSRFFAELKYELATKEGIDFLVENGAEMHTSYPHTKFLHSQIIDGYCKTENWHSLSSWLSSHDAIDLIFDPLLQWNTHYLMALEKYHDDDKFNAWELIKDAPMKITQNYVYHRGADLVSSFFNFRESLSQTAGESSDLANSERQSLLSFLKKVIDSSFHVNNIPLLVKEVAIKSDSSSIQCFLTEFLDYVAFNQQISFADTFVDDLAIWNSLNTAVENLNSKDSIGLLSPSQLDAFKFFLAKVSRKCLAFNNAFTILNDWKREMPSEVVFEHAKALFAQGRRQEAILRACTLLSDDNSRIIENTVNQSSDSYVLKKMVCLKLSKWLQNPELQLNKEVLSNIRVTLDGPTTDGGLPETENNDESIRLGLTESCLSRAVDGESSCGKAWFTYASYHYQRGRKMLEELGSGKISTSALHNLRRYIQEILTNDWKTLNADESIGWDAIIRSVFKIFLRKFSHRSKFGLGDLNNDFKAVLPWVSQDSVNEIATALQEIQEKIFDSYRSSVDGYFKFLQFANCRKEDTKCGERVHYKRVEESDKTTACLRLLRLLVKHGSHIEASFMAGFDNIDVRSWENIIPQLFSRLDHPDPFVQHYLCKLLCAIASNSPQLVVYHTVVASNSAGTSEQNKQLLQKIAESLDNTNGALIAEIRHVIRELQHITVLFEELWFNKISGLQLDINKRFHKIEREFERINDNLNLSSDQRIRIMKESYDAIMKPIISSIERLCNKTVAVASTPHEKWFLDNFGNRIHDALELLRTPRSPETYKEGWEILRMVHKHLTKELQSSRSLKLADISPFLSEINSSQIAMPGLPSHHDSVYIQSFDEAVVILPTKTKPKKLILRGSDGKQYGYLFKGLEDLHLDERIMQLLQITNDLFRREKQSRQRNLRARNYAVIPLGDHSGMIQWVENATQMFLLYKKWQHREHFATILQNNNEPSTTPQRPSDMFFEKIGKALKKEGWAPTTSRRNWPHIVLRSVFLELLSETPRDLLEKEIWSSCASPTDWWKKSTSLSRSLAVMSVIGYVIGLGDRHLDNMMIDFDLGEVVHIDYNICFEKGKKLKVPETVPFRLTQNIEAALGVTGVEGVFRIACEIVLGVLRKNKEILTTLLEAFVYDPLVDWHQDSFEDRNKQMMEVEENLGLLTSRIAELRAPIEKNQERLSNLLSEFTSAFEHTWEHQVKIRNQQTEASDQAGSSSGADNLKSVGIQNDVELENLKSALSQRASECALWHAQHEKTIQSIQGPILQVIYNEVFSSSSQIGVSIFTPYLQILAANEFIIQRCGKVDQDLMGWMNERNAAFKSCLERLQFYRTLIIPIAQVLLAQDYYAKWPPVLVTLLESSLSVQDFQAINRTSSLSNAFSSEFNLTRENLRISSASILQESASLSEALNVTATNTIMSDTTLHLMLSNILSEIGSRGLNAQYLYSTSILLSLSELNQSLQKSDNLSEIYAKIGFDADFQFAIRGALSNEILDKASFLTFVGASFSLYYHINMANMQIMNDEVLHKITAITTELSQAIRIILSLQHHFENIVLPKIFLLIHSYPPPANHFISSLRELSAKTYNYWSTKHPEAQSIAESMNHSFTQIREAIYNETSSQGVSLIVNEFDELFRELKDTILKIQLVYDVSVSRLESLVKISVGNNTCEDISSLVSSMIGRGLFTDAEMQVQKLNVQNYCLQGSKMNYVAMVNLRKAQVEMDLQHRQMEIISFEWINEPLIGESSLIRRQFLQNLTHDVNRFAILEKLLQELSVQYRTIENEVAEYLSNVLIAENPEILHSFSEAVNNQQIIKHVVSLCNSILHLETFRTATDKTSAMDVDTLHLVKKLETAVLGRSEISQENSQLDISQQLANLKIDQSLELDQPRNLEIIAKDFYNTVDEIRGFIIDLIPLIEPISNAEIDAEDSGKDARSRAKEFLREWSNLDSEIDNVINGSITVIDERLKYSNETSDSESASILENLRLKNEQAISLLAQTMSRIFDNLSSLGEVLNTSNRQDLQQKILPLEGGDYKTLNIPGESVQSKSGLDYKPASPIETDGPKEKVEINIMEEDDQNDIYSNPINSQKEEQANVATNFIRRNSFLTNVEDAVEAWDATMQQGITAQTRNAFAVGIIRRIKAKLEGKDFDSTTKMTVTEQ